MWPVWQYLLILAKYRPHNLEVLFENIHPRETHIFTQRGMHSSSQSSIAHNSKESKTTFFSRAGMEKWMWNTMRQLKGINQLYMN